MSKLASCEFQQLQQWQQNLANRQNVSSGSKPIVHDSYHMCRSSSFKSFHRLAIAIGRSSLYLASFCMYHRYVPNFIVNSCTSGAFHKTSLTICRFPIDRLSISLSPLQSHAPELFCFSLFVARTTPDKPIKATVVSACNCSLD
jgi:hypothetical protein